MKKLYLVIFVIIIIVVLGFVNAAFLSSEEMCTLKGCSCKDVDGEIPCNNCALSKPVFTIGLLNVIHVCPGIEIITCENGKELKEERRVEIDYEKCYYSWYTGLFS